MYDGDQLASHFELEVWQQYVESPRPPPLVARLRKASSAEGLEIADVVRCRRSALLRNVHPLPVFCPLDDIKVRARPLLGDINFVTKSPNRSFASSLGYCGPRLAAQSSDGVAAAQSALSPGKILATLGLRQLIVQPVCLRSLWSRWRRRGKVTPFWPSSRSTP